MADVALNAAARTERGKGPARRLREQGKVPAIVYGRGRDPVALVVDARELRGALHGPKGDHALIDLKIDGSDTKVVLLKDLVRDFITAQYKHADFLEVDMAKPVEVEVSILLTGHAAGLMHGGVQDVQLRDVEVRCLPGSIPDHIEIDVSALQIGDSLHVSDLVPPAGVEILSDPGRSIVTITAPATEAKPAAEGEEAAAEAAAAAPAASEAKG